MKHAGSLVAAIVAMIWTVVWTNHPVTRTVVAQESSTEPTLVGREVCRECHAENHAFHSKHGHASTFHFVNETELPEKFSGQIFDAGQAHGVYHYQRDPQGNLLATLPGRFDEKPFPLQFAFGSGLHAQTMLTLKTDADGQPLGIEHRVSHYADGGLGLSPGHDSSPPQHPDEYFGDAHRGEPLQRCVHCHTTRAELVGNQIKDLIPNVNCEKCHGPGSEHVRLARNNPQPPPFSVGLATWDAESELQLCGDCHRLPHSVSEKEIREYPDVLVRFQPIGMLRSRCYLQSDGRLRCTTCHNPHQSLREVTAADHVQDCLGCHQPDSPSHVACPVEPTSGCIECHMPSVELNPGLHFHDHWIRVVQE